MEENIFKSYIIKDFDLEHIKGNRLQFSDKKTTQLKVGKGFEETFHQRVNTSRE